MWVWEKMKRSSKVFGKLICQIGNCVKILLGINIQFSIDIDPKRVLCLNFPLRDILACHII